MLKCVGCGETAKITAKGLCGPCYHRQRRSGSIARTYVRNTGACSVEGCDNPSFAKNLCAHHYEKNLHPLNHTWRILRSRNAGAYPRSWDRFGAFLADVGERPSPKHQLRRLDGARPWSSENIHWLAPLGVNKSGLSVEGQRAYGREWNLRRKFKLTGSEYAELLNAQGGCCAVCGGKETHTYASGKIKDLAVDHDHETNVVRGLLCFNCNQGIGRLGDSPDRLRAAAAYLERHAKAAVVSDEMREAVVDLWNRAGPQETCANPPLPP